jgi:hypothetical protein
MSAIKCVKKKKTGEKEATRRKRSYPEKKKLFSCELQPYRNAGFPRMLVFQWIHKLYR